MINIKKIIYFIISLTIVSALLGCCIIIFFKLKSKNVKYSESEECNHQMIAVRIIDKEIETGFFWSSQYVIIVEDENSHEYILTVTQKTYYLFQINDLVLYCPECNIMRR